MAALLGLVALGFSITTVKGQAPEVVKLWPNGAPGSESRQNEVETRPQPWSIANITNPSLTVYRPAPGTSNGTAVIIAPGGGHGQLVVDEEGTKPAKLLAQNGVTALVLRYRLFREPNSGLTFDIHTRADTYRAVRVVRNRAKEFGISADRVGFMGFSAGGENASLAAFGDLANPTPVPDDLSAISFRPNFAIWIYPGPLGIPETIPADAPPAFLLVAANDGAANNILDLTKKYRAAKRPVEAHILGTGGHGFNMGDRAKEKTVNTWPQRLLDWLSDQGLLKA